MLYAIVSSPPCSLVLQFSGSSLRLCSFLRLQAILSALHTPPLGKLPALHLPALLSPFARWISQTQVSHSTPLSSPGATPSPIKSTPTPPATATTPASSHDSVHLVSPSPLTLLSCILFCFYAKLLCCVCHHQNKTVKTTSVVFALCSTLGSNFKIIFPFVY